VSSLSFSSTQGGKAILAVGRSNCQVMLYSPLESEREPRFDSVQPSPICCVAFRPTTVKRPSIRDAYLLVDTEELLVGDEAGYVYFYSVEWPTTTERDLFDWNGCLTLIARITVHTQQICGLAWSPDGESFASGGNDNLCYLFDTRIVLGEAQRHQISPYTLQNQRTSRDVNLNSAAFSISALFSRHVFAVAAAVKAIAFCPWQRGLLAIGGGSNDRRIHFFHTLSGAALATIDCHAQVTSLIWSTSRREIAATFGFAQPDHPYRIAVFSWPRCEIVVKIPWFDEHRALFAISFPGGPNTSRQSTPDRDSPSTPTRRPLRRLRRASTSQARWSSERGRGRGREGGVW
jgi:WD40 repeat protein